MMSKKEVMDRYNKLTEREKELLREFATSPESAIVAKVLGIPKEVFASMRNMLKRPAKGGMLSK